MILVASDPPFDLPHAAADAFPFWAIGWCVFCGIDWTVIMVGDSYEDVIGHRLLDEARQDHLVDCPNRPPIHDPEGLASWLIR